MTVDGKWIHYGLGIAGGAAGYFVAQSDFDPVGKMLDKLAGNIKVLGDIDLFSLVVGGIVAIVGFSLWKKSDGNWLMSFGSGLLVGYGAGLVLKAVGMGDMLSGIIAKA